MTLTAAQLHPPVPAPAVVSGNAGIAAATVAAQANGGAAAQVVNGDAREAG